MRITMDRSGRLVVPKAIRERLSLTHGGDVEISERDGVAEIRPATVEAELLETPLGVVISPKEPMPPLADDLVFETLDTVRR